MKRYAAGIGESWSVHISKSSHFRDGTIWQDTCRQAGTAYNYGLGKPNHPVPAICNHLHLIAAEPMLAWEDFKAIGWHGTRR